MTEIVFQLSHQGVFAYDQRRLHLFLEGRFFREQLLERFGNFTETRLQISSIPLVVQT